MFSFLWKGKFNVQVQFDFSSAIAVSLDNVKILSPGNGLEMMIRHLITLFRCANIPKKGFCHFNVFNHHNKQPSLISLSKISCDKCHNGLSWIRKPKVN